MDNTYIKIYEYLQFATQYYNVQICIKDFCGFVPYHKDMLTVLQPFLIHSNPFCAYIKSDHQTNLECLSMISKTIKKCEHDHSSFVGMCHAGLSEYVIPIISHKNVIGTINVGCFTHDYCKSKQRIHNVCQASSSLLEETALRLFNKAVKPYDSRCLETLFPALEVIAEYFSHTYNTIQSENGSLPHKHYVSKENEILSKALEYIRQNYTESITLEHLAHYCDCSISHLSHIFKRRVGVNIITYVNKLRIEDAKIYLESSHMPISDIALTIGFNDPNYFSKTFTNLASISPKEYRRRFNKISDSE